MPPTIQPGPDRTVDPINFSHNYLVLPPSLEDPRSLELDHSNNTRILGHHCLVSQFPGRGDDVITESDQMSGSNKRQKED